MLNLIYSLKVKVKVKSLSLCDPMDCSLPGFSVHGIFQARILEWFTISFSRDLPKPGIESTSPASQSPALQADSFLTKPLGKPFLSIEPQKGD